MTRHLGDKRDRFLAYKMLKMHTVEGCEATSMLELHPLTKSILLNIG